MLLFKAAEPGIALISGSITRYGTITLLRSMDNWGGSVPIPLPLYGSFFVRVVTYRSSPPTPPGRFDAMKSVCRSAAM